MLASATAVEMCKVKQKKKKKTHAIIQQSIRWLSQLILNTELAKCQQNPGRWLQTFSF